MNFPFVVAEGLTPGQIENFKLRFGLTGDYDRSVRENVWRRHQDPINSSASGWVPGAQRRRIVHYRDKYGLIGREMALIEAYMFFHICAPAHEVDAYEKLISLGWTSPCGLRMEKKRQVKHPEDLAAGREVPEGYENLDVWVYSQTPSRATIEKPWVIFRTGIRAVPPRGSPKVISKDDLESFFPAAVELGCGPSIEAGVPPLNFFHRLFSLHKDNRFVLRAEQDGFMRYFADTEAWYRDAVQIHRLGLLAKPTGFYHLLKRWSDEGKIVGPVLSNNFDGLPLSVGLVEEPLRRHDGTGCYPEPNFHPSAKSLLVIGSHADRRRCQHFARLAGLKVVHIDPEGYGEGEKRVSYPIESPQDGDFVLRLSASELL